MTTIVVPLLDGGWLLACVYSFAIGWWLREKLFDLDNRRGYEVRNARP